MGGKRVDQVTGRPDDSSAATQALDALRKAGIDVPRRASLPARPLYSRILIATDGAPSSLAALAWGAHLAPLLGAQLAVLAVGPAGLTASAGAEETEGPERVAREAAAWLGESGVQAKPMWAAGNPGTVIVNTCASEAVDLLILGSHQHGGQGFYGTGGTGEIVKNAVAASVLVARTAPPATFVISAVDGSDESLEASAVGLALARLGGSPHLMLAARPPEGTRTSHWPRLPPSLPAAGGALAVTGDPVRELVSLSQRSPGSLLVLGCRGAGGRSTLNLGTVSDRVSVFAASSVLVVKPAPGR
jgi:nucleotide-binding universal stress UspA family protein